MRDVITVIKFTINEMVKRKSFIISTILILVLIVLGFNVPNIISNLSTDNTEEKILIVDNTDVFEGNLQMLKELPTGYDIEIGEYTYEDIKQKLEENEIDSALIIENKDNTINIRYIIENKSMTTYIPENLLSAISDLYSNIQIKNLGLTDEQLQKITPNFETSIEETGESAKGNIFVMMIMSIVLFYAIYFCAYQVSSSITTEKTSKIIETLVTSTSPKTIVLGKTIGIGIVGLIQLILIVLTALISAKFCIDKELLNSVLDMSNITIYLGIITIIYFILGYFTYAVLYALTGSTVSKPEDIQSANTPVALLAVAGFYLSYFTMMNPSSELNVFASIFPFSSPFCMPFRIMMGLASVTDVIISILVLIITILIISIISIKIYSNAILHYGSKISIKDILNMFKK